MKKISLVGLFIWGLASLFYLYEFFLQVFLSTISGQIMREFHLDASDFSIMNAGYFLPYSMMQIPVGILVDRFGARRLLIVAIAAAATGVFWFSKISTFEMGFISRFFMGFGSSFAYVSLLVLALNWFPKKHFGLMVGLANFLGATGPFLAGGPLSLLLNAFDHNWRLILVYISILGFILATCVGFFVRNGPRRKKGTIIHLDPYKEKLSARLKLLGKNAQAWAIVLYSGFVYVSTPLLGAYWGTGYLVSRGLSQTIAATISSFLWIGFAVGGPLTGKVSELMKRRKPILILCGFFGLLGSLSILYFPTQEVVLFATFFFLIGFASTGCSVAFASISEHVQGSVQATAIGFNNSMLTFFAALFPPIAGFLIEMGTTGKPPLYTAAQYETGLILMPCFYLISLTISSFFIRETFCRSQHEVIKVNLQP